MNEMKIKKINNPHKYNKSNSLSFDSFLSSPHPQLSSYVFSGCGWRRGKELRQSYLSLFSFIIILQQ